MEVRRVLFRSPDLLANAILRDFDDGDLPGQREKQQREAERRGNHAATDRVCLAPPAGERGRLQPYHIDNDRPGAERMDGNETTAQFAADAVRKIMPSAGPDHVV